MCTPAPKVGTFRKASIPEAHCDPCSQTCAKVREAILSSIGLPHSESFKKFIGQPVLKPKNTRKIKSIVQDSEELKKLFSTSSNMQVNIIQIGLCKGNLSVQIFKIEKEITGLKKNVEIEQNSNKKLILNIQIGILEADLTSVRKIYQEYLIRLSLQQRQLDGIINQLGKLLIKECKSHGISESFVKEYLSMEI